MRYEALVTEAFADVLGEDEDEVPQDVPFVQLGGSSLDAAMVCARLGRRLGRDVPASGMVRRQTVRAMAAWLAELADPLAGAGGDRSIEGHAGSAEIPLTPEQAAFLIGQLTDPGDRSAYCLLVWAVEGRWDVAAFDAALTDVQLRHEALNCAYRLDEEPVAVPGQGVAPRTTQLGEWPSEQRAVAALRAELAAELDLEHGVVWRCAVAGVAGAPVRLVGLVIHHIAFDGWSEAVLADDLARAYNARLRGLAPGLPALPGLAAQQAARRRRSDRAVAERQLEHRAAALSGLPDLPLPAVSVPATRRPAAQLEQRLSAAQLAGVDRLAATHGVTRFVVLLASYGAALAEATGGLEFGVGVPVAGRSDHLTQQSVGCHVGTVCIRVRPGPLDAAGRPGAIRAAADAAADAFAAQDTAITDLVRAVNPPRQQGRTPLFQNIFALQDTAQPRLDLADADTRHLRQPYLNPPVELLTEIRPDPAGGAYLVISHRSGDVPDGLPASLAGALLRIVSSFSADHPDSADLLTSGEPK